MTARQLSIDDLAEGQRLRDEGMARVTAWSDERCIRVIDSMIQALNRNDLEWSANDLRVRIAQVWPEVIEAAPQLVGARVRSAATRGLMRKVGYTPSTLPSTHSHVIAVWRGVGGAS